MKDNARIGVNNTMSYESSSFKESIKKSWERCIGRGLNRQSKQGALKVSSDEPNCLLERYRHILELAKPYMKSVTQVIDKRGAILGFSSEEGVLLHIQGNVSELEGLGFQKGYSHLESHMGTNAVGTCIETGRAIIIWGEEHFLEALKDWVGFAAPIHGPKRHPKAILFIMMPVKRALRGIIILLSIAASSIESQLKLMDDKRKLIDMHEMMQETQSAIIETSSIVSHEVRNSLANISAYIQLLQLEKSINKYRGDKILGEITRVNRLLDDFRLLSGPQQNNLRTHTLEEMLKFVIDMMTPKAQLGKVEILCTPCPDDIHIRVDRNALHQVFINLIDNAIQAMEEEGGTLKVGIEREPEGGMVIISFQDTGPGIPQAELEQVFRIFHTTKRDGSGLGLHICQSIVRLHGGNIWVESQQGQGSTFFISLPMEYDFGNKKPG